MPFRPVQSRRRCSARDVGRQGAEPERLGPRGSPRPAVRGAPPSGCCRWRAAQRVSPAQDHGEGTPRPRRSRASRSRSFRPASRGSSGAPVRGRSPEDDRAERNGGDSLASPGRRRPIRRSSRASRMCSRRRGLRCRDRPNARRHHPELQRAEAAAELRPRSPCSSRPHSLRRLEERGIKVKARLSTSGGRQKSAEQSIGVKSHLCGLTTIESARSQPASTSRRSGRMAATPPYAASTWSQSASARRCRRPPAPGSTLVVPVVPTVAHTGDGPPARRAVLGDRARERARIHPELGVGRDLPNAPRARSRGRSRPSPTELCACSGGVDTRRRGRSDRPAIPRSRTSSPAASRAAASAHSVEIDAVS